VPLSREQLKDCSVGAPGCNGGAPVNMFTYVHSTAGLGTEAAYPYTPAAATCRGTLPTNAFSDTGYVTIAANELAFKAGVVNAPIAVTVCAETWDNYAGGVFTNCGDSQTCSVDHAVLLVGYGVDATLGNYWLIQNSWATTWGEKGFIRLPRTDTSAANTGACGLTRYPGYQAQSPAGGGGPPGSTDCKGSWGAYSACTKSCGSGTQTRTWTTTAQPTNGGVACPNPLTQSQACNTALCGGGTVTCLHVANSILGANGDGDYTKVADWNQGWCGTATNPQYTNTAKGLALFFYATNCANNVRVAGMWGFGPIGIPRAGYQWSSALTITNGVIPTPDKATGPSWTIQISTGTTCV